MFKYILAALSVMVMGFTCLQANPKEMSGAGFAQFEAKGKKGPGVKSGPFVDPYGRGSYGPVKITQGMPAYGGAKSSAATIEIIQHENRKVEPQVFRVGSKGHKGHVKSRANARRK